MGSVPLRLAFHRPGDLDPDLLACELDVLGHWYGDTREQLDEAYGPYLDQTCFLSLTHADHGPVGFCRLIVPGARPLKTVTDVEGAPWHVDGPGVLAAAGVDLSRTWDIATLGIRHRLLAPGTPAAAALYHGLIASTGLNGAPWVLAIVDRRVRSLLHMLSLPLHTIPGTWPAQYMGSAQCAPVYTHVASAVGTQREASPETFRLVTLGEGLEGVQVAPQDSFRLVPLSSPAG